MGHPEWYVGLPVAARAITAYRASRAATQWEGAPALAVPVNPANIAPPRSSNRDLQPPFRLRPARRLFPFPWFTHPFIPFLHHISVLNENGAFSSNMIRMKARSSDLRLSHHMPATRAHLIRAHLRVRSRVQQ